MNIKIMNIIYIYKYFKKFFSRKEQTKGIKIEKRVNKDIVIKIPYIIIFFKNIIMMVKHQIL